MIESYHRPRSIRATLRLLEAGGPKAKLLAGGTAVAARHGSTPQSLIDITHLGLSYVRRKGKGCEIGATATMADVESSEIIREFAGGMLAKACASCGSVQIRNMGTVGGNLANASPAADTATPLLALDAVLLVADARGRRRIPLTTFFTGPGETVLGDDLLIAILVPAPARTNRAGWSFQKLGRTRDDLALVNVAAGVEVDSRGLVKRARIALGAVAPTPIRARVAEELMTGRKLDAGLVSEVCDQVMREVRPATDWRASEQYRREMSGVLVGRALRDCAAQAGREP